MKYEIIIPAVVREEVTEAVDYYNFKQKGLGDDLYYDLIEKLEFIQKAPSSFQLYHTSYRQALLKKFPYLVIFRVFDNKVLVNKFIHAKKHPNKRYKNK